MGEKRTLTGEAAENLLQPCAPASYHVQDNALGNAPDTRLLNTVRVPA